MRSENIFIGLFLIVFIGYLFSYDHLSTLDICLVSISLFIFFILKLFLKYSLSFKYLTLPAFFIGVYFSVLYFPGLTAYALMPPDIGFWYLLSINSVLVTIPAGMLLYSRWNISIHNRIRNYCKSRILESRSDQAFKILFILSTFLLILGSVAYFFFAEFIQLIEITKAYPTPYGILEFRFGAEEVPILIVGIFEMSRRLLLPLCLMYLYTMAHIKKGIWRVVFFIYFPLSLLISISTLDRAPPIAILGSLSLLTLVLPFRNSIAKIVRAAFFILLAGLLGGFISVTQYQRPLTWDSVYDKFFYVLAYRIGQDPAYSACKTFQVYDSPEKHLNGRYIRMFSFLPGRKFYQSHGEFKSFKKRLVISSSFVGDLWRNWGYGGVLFGSLFIGYFYQFIQHKILRKKDISGTSIKVIVFVSCIWIIWGNMFGIVTTGVVLFSITLGKLAQYQYKLK